MAGAVPGGAPAEQWSDADAYEAYVGRWSRRVARGFVAWLAAGDRLRWLDIGAGTGALTGAIVEMADPAGVVGVDRSAGYLAHARRHLTDPRVRFVDGDAAAPPAGGRFDAAVSGLVLNFVPDAGAMVQAMAGAVVPGGLVAAYVWDYAGGMEPMRRFWDAAVALDEAARGRDQGARFPLCHPDRLHPLWRAAGLRDVATTGIQIVTRFRDFDDYWLPFTGGQGGAPGYLASLPQARRDDLRAALRASVPIADDGSVSMAARAWAVAGRVPSGA